MRGARRKEKGATYMQSALEGTRLMPNNLLKLSKLLSRPCLNSLPCGEGLGVGVAVCGRVSGDNYDPPPQPSPTRGEGEHRVRGDFPRYTESRRSSRHAAEPGTRHG